MQDARIVSARLASVYNEFSEHLDRHDCAVSVDILNEFVWRAGQLLQDHGVPCPDLMETMRRRLAGQMERGPVSKAKAKRLIGDFHKQLSGLASRLDGLAIARVLEELTSLRNEVERLGQHTAQPADVRIESRISEVEDARAKAFVIMPFSPDFNDVWEGGIVRATRELQVSATRADKITASRQITDDIIEQIDAADFVIMDVTGNNPNVMFEVGYTFAKQKPYIIIAQSAEDLPFDIKHIRTLVYKLGWSGVEDLFAELKEFISTVLDGRPGNSYESTEPVIALEQ
jgi:hypothetical protein